MVIAIVAACYRPLLVPHGEVGNHMALVERLLEADDAFAWPDDPVHGASGRYVPQPSQWLPGS
jgi:hypothetical protein